MGQWIEFSTDSQEVNQLRTGSLNGSEDAGAKRRKHGGAFDSFPGYHCRIAEPCGGRRAKGSLKHQLWELEDAGSSPVGCAISYTGQRGVTP